MNHAEMKTIRESLQLTLMWISTEGGVHVRTAQNWEAGITPIPDRIKTILNSMDESVEQFADEICTFISESRPVSVELLRFKSNENLWRTSPKFRAMPADTHAVLIYRIKTRLSSKSINLTISYFEDLTDFSTVNFPNYTPLIMCPSPVQR